MRKKIGSSKHGWLTHAWIIRLPSSKAEANISEIFGDLYVSKYAWPERGVWCGWMERVVHIARIIHPMDNMDCVCEILCTTGKTYHLKTSNIAAEVENLKSKKLKTMNLRKARKWWEEQSNKLKILKTNLITDEISLALENFYRLEQFMLRTIRSEHEGQVPEMPTPKNPIFKVLSSFSQREEIPEIVNEPGSSSAGKKQGKRVADANEAFKNMENQIIPLANEDIVSQIDQTPQSKKGKVDKADRRCPQPLHEEIDAGFVFGRNFTFHVSMEKVRPPTLETTNQRILSEENARTMYSKLRSGEINSSTLLTLRPISYTFPSDSKQNKTYEVVFQKRVSKTTFLETLNSMEGNNMEEKRNALLPNVTWELVDGQHIQYACNVLAREDFLTGNISKAKYEAIFIKRPAAVVVYNDEICYGVQSLKLNDYNTDRVYHGSLIERLAKARN